MVKASRVLTLGVATATMLALLGGSAAWAAGSKCTGAKFKATGKKAGSRAKCFSKAASKGGVVDQACLTKADGKFSASFTKAEASNDCLAPKGDASDVEFRVDVFVDDIVGTIATSPGGSFTGNKCNGAKIAATGKKASGKASCYSKAASKGAGVDSACLMKAETKFNTAIGKAEGGGGCTHTGQGTALEGKVDAFINHLAMELNHTLAAGPHLSFAAAPGTSNCGGAGLATPPSCSPPCSGEIDSDTGGTTKISDLGLSCLYIGGGNGNLTPPGAVPDGSAIVFDVSGGTTLVASDGTGPDDCSKGAGPGKHCVNVSSPTVTPCATDSDCPATGQAGSCQLDANCFFGPPLPIPNPTIKNLTTCVLNVIQTNGSGTVNSTTGDAVLSLPLSSRVHVTGNVASPCPKCVSGTCTTGANAGKSCTAVGSLMTSNDCPPSANQYVGALPVNLSPLTTGASITTSSTGQFCPGQNNAGAFGQATTRAIKQNGSPGGNLTDMNPHPAVIGYSFCIPATGNAGIDAVADLPGPGSVGLNGSLQLQ